GGTVFKVTATGVYKLLYKFSGLQDGGQPYAGLVRDAQGNLYGTTVNGGLYNAGVVFKVTPKGTESVLHHFQQPGSSPDDGGAPTAALILDPTGNLFGTTLSGTATGSYGTVFEVTSNGEEKLLHSFTGPDGRRLHADLIQDAQGNLYGTAYEGGIGVGGTVFEITSAG